jgi:uncharacterized membrane protein YwzB
MLPVLDGMSEFWGMPNIKQLRNLFSPKIGNTNCSYVWIIVPFAVLGIISLIKERNKIAFSVAFSLFFVFSASFIGKWPLTGRLWLFLPVIIFIFTPIGFNFINNKIKYEKYIKRIKISLFSVMIIYLTINCLGYTVDKMYYETEEINPLISYIQRNIKEDEKLYVYPPAKPAFDYKNGYNSTKIGNVAKDNIIYGKDRNEWNEISAGNELHSILENKKTYLLFQHYSVGIDKGLSVLRNYGTLTEVMNVYDTPLYYFELTENKDKDY